MANVMFFALNSICHIYKYGEKTILQIQDNDWFANKKRIIRPVVVVGGGN